MKTLIEEIDLRITDKWGVRWDEMEIVRDFLQNFYDANPSDKIGINVQGNSVEVTGESEFDGNLLDYLTTDKYDDDNKIGQYGEGYKAAVLNIMRNHQCEVSMTTGGVLREYFFKERRIGNSVKKVLLVRLYKIDPIIGSKLRVLNCPPSIISNFEFGLDFFLHPKNRLLGNVLYRSGDKLVCKSTKSGGFIFYKNLLRGSISAPIIISCSKPYQSVDDKIKHDRDRKAFNDEVQVKVIRFVFSNINIPATHNILNHMKEYWQSGHQVLGILSSKAHFHTNFEFPVQLYARETDRHRNQSLLLEERVAVEDEFKAKGYVECPGYMHSFGMKTVASVALDRRKKSNESATRPPNKEEFLALEVAIAFIKEIAPELATRFSNTKYILGESDHVLGELRSPYGRKEVFLNVDVFQFGFSDIVAIILHEWSHIYGYDSSRGFTDALTSLISLIINQKNILSKVNFYQEKWDELKRKAISGRVNNQTSKLELFRALTDQQKEAVLQDIDYSKLLSTMSGSNKS